MNTFCLLIFLPSLLPSRVVGVRCDPRPKWALNFFTGQANWARQLLFCKTFTSCSLKARKRGKSSSTSSSQESSHLSTILSQCCLTQKWPDFSQIHSAIAKQCEFWPKKWCFLQISGKWVGVSGCKFCLNLFRSGAHLPYKFHSHCTSSVAGYRGQTNKLSHIQLYISK